jgi:hypothetical protein
MLAANDTHDVCLTLHLKDRVVGNNVDAGRVIAARASRQGTPWLTRREGVRPHTSR